MDGLPLHPAVVHFPIALAAILPLVSGGLALAIVWHRAARRTWLVVVVLHALLLATGLVARETGEDDEEAVERVVAERHIEEHEERADRFLWTVGAGLGASTLTLAAPAGSLFTLGAVATTIGSIASGALAYTVGHTGGELVYRHGAASAWVSTIDAPRRPDDD